MRRPRSLLSTGLKWPIISVISFLLVVSLAVSRWSCISVLLLSAVGRITLLYVNQKEEHVFVRVSSDAIKQYKI